MTLKQRISFFKLVSNAWHVSGVGLDKDEWRRKEMAEAVPGCDSLSKVKNQEDYEEIMLHFAKLANDHGKTMHYCVARERRLRFVLGAIEADLSFLRGSGIGDAYMEGIYHQMGHPSYCKIDDIPAEYLRTVIQIADTYVRKLRSKAGIELRRMPSYGAPWHIRGRPPAPAPSNAPQAAHATP